MTFARFVFVFVAIACAGWLAWPVLSPMIETGSMGVAALRAGPLAEAVALAGLPFDPTWLILGALLVLGLFVVILSRRRRRHPGPWAFAY